jgi:hypothetical protein
VEPVQRPKTASSGSVTLAGVEIPLLDEAMHFTLIGMTGSGRSTAIREPLTGALQRGDRAIIANPDGSNLAGRWIREGSGVLFLPYQASQIAALKNLIATWLRLAIFETMSLGEGDHRLWFAIDELDALGQIDGLKDALARLRKFGGRCLIGLQSIAQLRGNY